MNFFGLDGALWVGKHDFGTLNTLGGIEGLVEPPGILTVGYPGFQWFSQIKNFEGSIVKFVHGGIRLIQICPSSYLGSLNTLHLFSE